MSAPKVGDRVRVEFEGTVDQVIDGLVRVKRDNRPSSAVLEAECTVIAPPVKVGDEVTPENIRGLPDWSVLCPDADAYNPYQKRNGDWYEMCDHETQQSSEDLILSLGMPVIVLRIGGGSS